MTVTEEGQFGIVSVAADNKEAIDKAMARINAITAIPEIGKVYSGKVKSIVPFGAFVEIIPGKDGLLHISEIDWKRVEKTEDVLKEGEIIDVKLIEIDAKSGKLKLSRKVLLPREEKQ
ncbi:S1 RNA-binding domain-containing protein [Geofilum rubicundum]|uniref:Polyribonucleotide nucleotidyltransferase n=1 Tax=Geofilum rubicundum JCM 15548 TaxID=1236989 RepID=A0A0E9M148_9BACT|nr:S1 RNA-binding domain-containing protein [Geofilum rubicundum]GAO31532.1 polyribonucleotide nucleotidyltransferase [Geofilum rubicundum JCM 15548]